MTIRDLLLVIRQRWWVLLLCVVLGTGVGAIAAISAPTTYASSAQVLVAVPGVDQGALQLPGGITVAQRVSNYQALATGDAVLQKVIDDLHLGEPTSQLAKQIGVDNPAGTTMLSIKATATTATQAQQLAQSIAENLVASAGHLEGAIGVADPGVVLSVTDPAALPLEPQSSGLASKTALGFIAGLVVGAGVLWLLEYLDTSVRRQRDVTATIGAPVLGTVERQVSVALPAGGSAAESFRTVRTALQFAHVDADTPVFVVAGVQDAHCAATTAANLAAAQAKAGQRVLLVDADLKHATLSGLVNLDGRPGLSEWLDGDAAGEVIARWEAGGCDVLPAGTPAENGTERIQSAMMDTVLDKVRREYDAVIVASAPASTTSDAALLGTAGDGVVLAALWGKTSRADLELAYRRATMGSGTVLGVVLADVPSYRWRAEGDHLTATA